MKVTAFSDAVAKLGVSAAGKAGGFDMATHSALQHATADGAALPDAFPLEADRRSVERSSGRQRHRITDPSLVLRVRKANGRVKRLFDIVASGLALLFLAPIMGTLALLIAAADGGPAFYGHQRVGRYGRMFRCWKFRSMVTNGDEVLRKHFEANPAARVEWDETQKLAKDPRVTWLGRILRATSIDELPQLWNVLRGDMSLVGPRPITRGELNERYRKHRRYYLLVRPGITGLWQVSGRNKVSYGRRIALDRTYVETWSFTSDLQILLRTVMVVITRDGAS